MFDKIEKNNLNGLKFSFKSRFGVVGVESLSNCRKHRRVYMRAGEVNVTIIPEFPIDLTH